MNSSKTSDLNNNDGDNDPFCSWKSLCLDAYSTESIIFPVSWKAFSEIEIERIELATRNDRLCVTWMGTSSPSSSSSSLSSSSSFPLIWLRDYCRCPGCFNASTLSRIAPLKNINGNNIKPEKVSLTDDKKFLIINWEDGHVSHYPARWLRCNAFSESEPDPLADIQLQLWDASTCRDRMRKFDFNDLLSDDRVLYEMFLEVKVLGIALIENTPLRTGQLNKLADKVGFLFQPNTAKPSRSEAKKTRAMEPITLVIYLFIQTPLPTTHSLGFRCCTVLSKQHMEAVTPSLTGSR
nr:trimethyllysine dioxygenase, mitochondrial-like [Lytechinus pictus]